jgi:hypothetical protein
MGLVVLLAVLLFAYFCALRNFARNPNYINAWPILFLAEVTVLCFSENPLFNNNGTNELILVSIITAAGLKGWVRKDGKLVRAEARAPTWTAEPIGNRVPAR